MADFKPGDVVVHSNRGRGLVQDLDVVRWAAYGGFSILPDVAADLRRLVVIDVEDREQVERLSELLYVEGFGETEHHRPYRAGWADAARAALREFANPKPPKPEEPTGLGAVVEDAAGTVWVRTTWPEYDDDHLGKPWAQGPVRSNWLIVDAVRVLNEGVQP